VLGFPGNVLFEISLQDSVASLDEISAFKGEHQIMLSPYQWLSLNGVRWDGGCCRWILSGREEQDLPGAASWFVKPGSTSQSPAKPS
jgi:hypothetical protein